MKPPIPDPHNRGRGHVAASNPFVLALNWLLARPWRWGPALIAAYVLGLLHGGWRPFAVWRPW